MKYTVLWKPEGERRLTELWTYSLDRTAITAAANKIDWRLRIDPDQVGESRGEDRRLLIELPLGVTFRVLTAERIVHVTTVWQIQRRQQ